MRKTLSNIKTKNNQVGVNIQSLKQKILDMQRDLQDKQQQILSYSDKKQRKKQMIIQIDETPSFGNLSFQGKQDQSWKKKQLDPFVKYFNDELSNLKTELRSSQKSKKPEKQEIYQSYEIQEKDNGCGNCQKLTESYHYKKKQLQEFQQEHQNQIITLTEENNILKNEISQLKDQQKQDEVIEIQTPRIEIQTPRNKSTKKEQPSTQKRGRQSSYQRESQLFQNNQLSQISLQIKQLHDCFNDKIQAVTNYKNVEESILQKLENLLGKYQLGGKDHLKYRKDIKELYGELISVKQQKEQLQQELIVMDQFKNNEIKQIHQNQKGIIQTYKEEQNQMQKSKQTDEQILKNQIKFQQSQMNILAKENNLKDDQIKNQKQKIQNLIKKERQMEQQQIELQTILEEKKYFQSNEKSLNQSNYESFIFSNNISESQNIQDDNQFDRAQQTVNKYMHLGLSSIEIEDNK